MVNLEVITLVIGPLASNTYLVSDKRSKQGFVLDPAAEPKKILKTIDGQRLAINALVVTHCHFDHLGAIAQLKDKLKIPFLIPQGEEKILAAAPATAKLWTGQEIKTPPPTDGFLKEGDEVTAGKIKFEILSTPGHSPAGISLYNQEENTLFSGDTLFSGSVGRVDLPGGSGSAMKNSLEKLLSLPEKTLVLPGHGEKTTIGEEKLGNPFLQNLKNSSSFF